MADVTRIWKTPPNAQSTLLALQRIARICLIPLAVCAIISCLATAEARSPHPPPLRRLHSASSSSLEIIPRRRSAPSLNFRRAPTPPHPSTLQHDDTFFLSIDLPSLLSQPAHLLLRPTEDLFHPQAKITYPDGTTEPLRKEDWRLYTGDVIHPKWRDRLMWEESSGLKDERTEAKAVIGSARIMVHHPGSMSQEPVYEGMFTINGQHFNILTREHYDKVKSKHDIVSDDFGKMVVFRNADAWHDHEAHDQLALPSCSHDSLPYNSNTSHPIWNKRYEHDFLGTVFKRQGRDDTGGMAGSSNYIDSIGNSAGCPSTQQVVYMGVAVDCNYIKTYGSASQAREQVLNNWNTISALYRSTFNISLGIIDLVVQNNTCPAQAMQGTEWDVDCDAGLTLDQRLSLFSQWRGNRGDDGAGLWHLMSSCPTDTEVGVAWLGTLCQSTSNYQGGSYVSGTGISTATRTEWSLVAHEIGHGFGAIHDCYNGCSLSDPCCPSSSTTCNAEGRFIMNPTTSETEETFSPCTLGNICSNLGSRLVSSSCVVEPGSRTVISSQQCGNGIVEDGEDCDPGMNGDTSCCDPETCRFREGAICDPTNSACCNSQCQYASAGTVCRPAADQTCDYEETCSGNNATCPPDRTANDGTSCGSNGLACASGVCTSLDRQCQMASTSMNLTTACGQKADTSCVISCRDPRYSNQCVVLETPLVDGSPCGYSGHCYNQTCQAGSWQSTAASWYRQNLQISVPVTVVVGLIVLAILFGITRCIYRSCTGQPKRKGAVPIGNRQSMRQSQYNNPAAHRQSRPPPPPDGYWSGHNGNPNGGPHSHLPPPPPPIRHSQMNGYGQSNGWVDERTYNGQNYGRDEAWGR